MEKKTGNDDADNNVDTTQKPPKDTAKKTSAEPSYSIADIASAARSRFKLPPEVVQTALKLAKKEKATLEEAQKIVKDFMERKVKK